MRFRKLQLQNFKSHTDTTLELKRLTVIRGLNGVGKSAIEQALQIMLAGRTEATTADGKGSSGLIRFGEQKAHITLAVQTPGPDGNVEERIMRCALNGSERRVLVAKPDDPAYAGGVEWMESLAQHKDTLSCLINNRYFVDLKADAQADILASIILPKTYQWPDWVGKACFDCGLPVKWSQTPFDIIAQGYDLAYKERTGVNRDLKNFTFPEGDTSAADQLEEHSKTCGTLRTQLDDARRRKTQMEATSKANLATIHAARTRLNEAEGRIAQHEKVASETVILTDAERKALEKQAKAAKRVAELDADISKIRASIEVIEQTCQRLNAASANPNCPTCNTALTEEAVAAIAGPLLEEKNQHQADLDKLVPERAKYGNPAEAKAQLERDARAQADLKRIQQMIADDRTIVADAQAKLDELSGTQAPDTSAIDAEIAELIAKVDAATLDVDKARAAKELAGRIEHAKAAKRTLESKQQTLEKLVTYFGEQVRAELLKQSVGAFEESMNEVLANWGYRCHISIDPYVFAIAFRAGDKEAVVPLAHLSKSQRYRFATAFQVALAIVSDFRFVVVDEADIFDSQSRGGLFQSVMNGELHQAIVLVTDEREEAPAMEGAVYYRLDDVAEPGMLPTTHARKLEPATAA